MTWLVRPNVCALAPGKSAAASTASSSGGPHSTPAGLMASRVWLVERVWPSKRLFWPEMLCVADGWEPAAKVQEKGAKWLTIGGRR